MKTTLSIIRNLSARTLAFSGIVATTLSTFATPASASVLNNRVFQLEVAKRGPNGETLCLAVDISKIGVLPAANRAKVEPCRNIAEQQFRTVSVDNTYFRIQTAHAAPDGQAKCLDTNVTKIGVVAGANQSYFGNCANIQEQLYSKFRHDYANPVRQLLKVGTTSPHYCLDIDGSKYGVLPAAQFAKFGGCARVDEQWITFRSLSALTPVPTGWRHLLLGTGHALNTNFGSRFHNAQFNRPAVGLWQAISGDPDQFFRFEPQLNGSYLVRNNKTGLCMDSTANPQAGSKVIVHDCNPGNTNQFWDPLPQGNNVYLLQRSGTNLCLDSTGQNVDGTHTHLWPCDGGNGNQRFASAYVAPPAPPANQPPSNDGSGGSDGPTLIRTGGTEYVKLGNKQYFDVQAWLVVRRRPRDLPLTEDGLLPGHAFVGVVGRDRYTGHWVPIRTYSFWPRGEGNSTKIPNTDLTVNFGTDFGHLQDLLHGKSISDRGHGVRKARLSAGRAIWFINYGHKNANCKYYPPVPIPSGFSWPSETCHCAHYSTRLWSYITGGWESFEIEKSHRYSERRVKYKISPITAAVTGIIEGIFHEYWPDALVDTIEELNEQTGTEFLDNGRPW